MNTRYKCVAGKKGDKAEESTEVEAEAEPMDASTNGGAS